MLIWLRQGGRILLSHELHFPIQRYPTALNVSKFGTTIYPHQSYDGHQINRPPDSRGKRLRCPVPSTECSDISKWIPYLDRYLPPQLRASSIALPEAESQSEAQQCQAILQLLFQARTLMNFDLLTYIGFKQKRWQALTVIVDKLLHSAENLRSHDSQRPTLPSNIDWKKMGSSFNDITADKFSLPPIVPMTSDTNFNSLVLYDYYSEEPMLDSRMGEQSLRVGTMEELWQSLGYFILEVADMSTEESTIVMRHFYYIVARLHNLGYIPENVYKDVPKSNFEPPLRPPIMHLLSTRIISILTDTILEANVKETPASNGHLSAMDLLKSSERLLGFGVWLELVLWCCVEGGFARGASWILRNMRRRSNQWKVASFTRIIKKSGPIDHRKIDSHDTWENCGQLSMALPSKRTDNTFLGMGERTITQEVVVAVMEGLTNTVRSGVGLRGDSVAQIWGSVGLLRGLLNSNSLYVHPRFFNYLIFRILEAGGIVVDVKPQALEALLNISPSISTANELDKSSEELVKLWQNGYEPNDSAMMLGLYHYILDLYTSTCHISGAIEVLERLIGTVDSTKVHLIRELIMDSKYLNRAQNVLKTSGKCAPVDQSSALRPLASLQLSPSSLYLLLNSLTDAKVFSIASWILNPHESAGPIIPKNIQENEILSPAVIRFAAAINDPALVADLLDSIPRPLSKSTLHAMLDYTIAMFHWKDSLELLLYLRDVRHIQWEPRNIASLAAAVIKLEQPYGKLTQFSSPEDQAHALSQGKKILTYVLEGKFNIPPDFSKSHDIISQRTLFQLHRIFESIQSPSLAEVCKNCKLEWNSKVKQHHYIPAETFSAVLAAVVQVYGSSSGQRLYLKWCASPTTARACRIDSGGNDILASQLSLGLEKLERWQNVKDDKLVMPDLNVVRTIALSALEEQNDLTRGHEMLSSEITAESVNSVLDWCMRIFFDLGLRDRDIDKELDGHLTRSTAKWRQQWDKLVAENAA
ncbi:hypothetical protein LOZ53_002363 [Ophidiomyces ophidiicola]|nr:hypothetical protein LOZ55_003313 [Ophidiomyces ophidiicola]KAI1989199.1 hypothetical protein LOZ54_002935 [Ophidiomyces ophidiicola]KAI1992667.1 hypothetical protein LOZ53_002363 [Ophidiomyces ophidiicola]KAI1992961.1 hypothetical protein LOZ51_004277 [Ophidiomyces ophidiicola]